MWEKRNSNIDSSENTENSRSVIESDEVNHAVRKEAYLKRPQILNSPETRGISKKYRE